MIPLGLYSHIKIEEINSLTDDEQELLLFICNAWAPIRPPVSEDPNFIFSLNLIRATRRDAIIDRVIQAERAVKDEGKELYESLRNKLSIPVDQRISLV